MEHEALPNLIVFAEFSDLERHTLPKKSAVRPKCATPNAQK